MTDVGQRSTVRAGADTAAAFFRIGRVEAISYPLGFVLGNLTPTAQVLLFFFLSRLLGRTTALGGTSYFLFAVTGFMVSRMLGAGLDEFSNLIQKVTDQGQLELYLVQPVHWLLLPFAWLLWLIVFRSISVLFLLAVALVLGARFRVDSLPLLLLVLFLGILAVHGIGVIAASVRVLAKRADPIVTVYSLSTALLAGMVIPISVLPPVLRPLRYVIPHTYVVDAVRRLMLADGAALRGFTITHSLIGLVVFIVVTYAIGLYLFSRSLDTARRFGLLGAY